MWIKESWPRFLVYIRRKPTVLSQRILIEFIKRLCGIAYEQQAGSLSSSIEWRFKPHERDFGRPSGFRARRSFLSRLKIARASRRDRRRTDPHFHPMTCTGIWLSADG